MKCLNASSCSMVNGNLMEEIHHPKQNWPVEVPTVTSNIGRKYILKFLKRHKKLCRKLAQLDDDQNQQFTSDFLSTLRRQFHSRQTDDENSGKSYDSSLHDIFKEFQEKPLPKQLLQNLGSLQKGFILRGYHQGEWGTADGPSQLTLDFDDVDEAIVTQQYEKIKKKKMIKDVDSKSVSGNRQPLSSHINDFDKAAASKSHIASVHNKQPTANAKPNSQLANLRDFGRHVTEQQTPQFYSPRLNQLSKYSKKVFQKGRLENKDYVQNEFEHDNTKKYRQLVNVKSSDPKGFGFSNLLQNTPSRRTEANQKTRHEPVMNFMSRHTSGQSSQLSTRQMVSQKNIETHYSTHNFPSHPTTFHQSPQMHQPLTAKSPPSIENPQTARNDFDQLRKRALELLNDERNYPTVKRVGSPRYQLYKR